MRANKVLPGRFSTLRASQGSILLTVALGVAWVATAQAAHPDAPVITSFVVTDLGNNQWRLSGTVTASEGLEGLGIFFGGLVDDGDFPESDGTFSLDVTAEPIPGDWVTVHAVDRFELQSDTVTEYF